jgi:hypothetical protein
MRRTHPRKGGFFVTAKRGDPIFTDTSGMRPGDSITFDPSKEGIGGSEEGTIARVYPNSLVLKDSGKPVAVTRVITHRHPDETDQARLPLPTERRERRWPPPEREKRFPS